MDKVRETALLVLYEIEENGAYSNIALKERISSNFTNVDKSLITEIVYGIIKRKLYIDFAIKKLSKIKFAKISPWIVNILRMGIYQIVFLDKVPNSAAVDESVKLAKRYGHASSSGFVNAILRKIAVEGMPQTNDANIWYSYPKWMADRFFADYGESFARKLMAAGNETPPIYVRANKLKTDTLDLQKTEFEDMYIWSGGNIVGEDFKNGMFTVQDAAFSKAGFSLLPKSGMKVLDACAAPGGKTTHIAEIMKNEGEVVAWDIHDHKLKLIEETASRLGISIIKTELQNAQEFRDDLVEKFDRILCDVPCSGLGIVRRKPDIKWNRNENDILELAKIQYEILSCCSKYLKKGGILLYSTCTYCKEENRNIMEHFLEENKNFEIVMFEDGKDTIELFPNIQNTDGCFMFRVMKK